MKEENVNSFDDTKKYPLKNQTFSGKKRKKKKYLNLLSSIQNPSISHFNIDSHIIYSEYDFINYFNSLSNKNFVKLNSVEIDYLKEITNENKILYIINEKNDFIEIDENINNKLKNFKTINNKEDEITNFIKYKIINSENRASISCRKLSAIYLQEKGRFISKSTVHNIIKNKLGFHYLKTCKKSNFLNTDEGIFCCLAFIKVIYKSLIAGFELIFLDESTVKVNNSNFKCWRYCTEEIYFGKSNKSKINLLLAVTKNEIFHYELTCENTNSEKFLNFMKSLNDKLKNKKDKKYLIIMDNCTVHKTEDLIKYYKEEKINILFNVQYCSFFNCVELCFRALKKKLYNKLMETKEEVINEIKIFFDKEETKTTLIKNYNETLKQYISYSKEKKNININNLKLED